METIASESPQTISESEYLSFLIGCGVDNNFSVAVWRLPNDENKHLIISRKHELIQAQLPLEDLPSGFIVAPFDAAGDRIFLKADLTFTFSNNSLKTPENTLETTSATWLQTQMTTQEGVSQKYHRQHYRPDTTEKDVYINTVAKGIREIEKGTFEKVVPSRAHRITLPPDFDIVQAFQRLCDGYPDALITFVSTPESGSWLGATPELLVSVEDKSVFKTVALAGTQAFVPGTRLKDVGWTQKDIEEQALVERYIISCFKKIRLREFEEHGPKTVIAGNLLHLKSEFKVDMVSTNFSQLGSVMLQLLHPTSAVCGVPLEPSLEFLLANEGYQRQFYSGYLGPVNFKNNIDIFVNLRCAQLLGDQAILYAGAGVTADSIPEQEWEETEMKLNTLLKVLVEK
jgi:isochorismate synthase